MKRATSDLEEDLDDLLDDEDFEPCKKMREEPFQDAAKFNGHATSRKKEKETEKKNEKKKKQGAPVVQCKGASCRRLLPDSSDERSDEVSPKKKKSRRVQSSNQKKRLIPDTNSDDQKLPKKKPATAKVRAKGGSREVRLKSDKSSGSHKKVRQAPP
jgi:hypothetical protein